MSPKKSDSEETEQLAGRSRSTASAEPAVAAAPDRTLYWAVAFLGAVVFFGAGYLVGQEVNDHSDFDGHRGRGMIIFGHHGDLNPGMFPPFTDHPGSPDANDGRGYLGIAGIDTPGGVSIVEVVPDSPADEAGVEAGDRIVAFDGVEISSMEQLAHLVGATDPGNEVELVLGGPGGGRTVTVTIGERP